MKLMRLDDLLKGIYPRAKTFCLHRQGVGDKCQARPADLPRHAAGGGLRFRDENPVDPRTIRVEIIGDPEATAKTRHGGPILSLTLPRALLWRRTAGRIAVEAPPEPIERQACGSWRRGLALRRSQRLRRPI